MTRSGKSPARPAVVTTSPVGGSCSAGPAAGPLPRIRWRPAGPAGCRPRHRSGRWAGSRGCHTTPPACRLTAAGAPGSPAGIPVPATGGCPARPAATPDPRSGTGLSRPFAAAGATGYPSSWSRLVHLMQYRSVLAAAAGRTAAFADVAAARRAHLRAAGEAEWRVGRPALLRLDELGGAVRLQRRLGARTPLRRCWLLRARVRALHRSGLCHFHGILLLSQRGRILADQMGRALGRRQD